METHSGILGQTMDGDITSRRLAAVMSLSAAIFNGVLRLNPNIMNAVEQGRTVAGRLMGKRNPSGRHSV